MNCPRGPAQDRPENFYRVGIHQLEVPILQIVCGEVMQNVWPVVSQLGITPHTTVVPVLPAPAAGATVVQDERLFTKTNGPGPRMPVSPPGTDDRVWVNV